MGLREKQALFWTAPLLALETILRAGQENYTGFFEALK